MDKKEKELEKQREEDRERQREREREREGEREGRRETECERKKVIVGVICILFLNPCKYCYFCLQNLRSLKFLSRHTQKHSWTHLYPSRTLLAAHQVIICTTLYSSHNLFETTTTFLYHKKAICRYQPFTAAGSIQATHHPLHSVVAIWAMRKQNAFSGNVPVNSSNYQQFSKTEFLRKNVLCLLVKIKSEGTSQDICHIVANQGLIDRNFKNTQFSYF